MSTVRPCPLFGVSIRPADKARATRISWAVQSTSFHWRARASPRQSTDEKYCEFKFSHNVYYRTGRPLEKQDRLRILALRVESPFEMMTAVTAVGMGAGVLYGIVKLV